MPYSNMTPNAPDETKYQFQPTEEPDSYIA